MGYEDVIHEAERLGVVMGEMISDLNTTRHYDDGEIYAHLIAGLLRYCGKREEVLDRVREIMSEGEADGGA